MSRVAKNPVAIPAKVEVVLSADAINVSGPLGKLTQPLTGAVVLQREGETITFAAANDAQHSQAMSGTLRALVANMVKGVSEGFTRKLTLVGVGYKAAAQGAVLNLELGYSHPINHKMPEGVTVATPTPTEVVLTGVDKQVIGQVAAQIRAYRAPEPYKGKGVRYADEVVVIKETKKK
ncbi:50S ribosomal protein L6 [Methylotenera mobilis]|uniref:Large ribosomal subunit protein uL6 n=1 Tax=Methylotenera mobilis (strain JLW8 / ATCC BAA-1282 / DSM 17540) TaxID=583345 RepID=C6WTE8_METML|nr:50S ribosomal protein L6 [Methylotenera mobilis]ACT47270.1 ribosomal protein L6 [Methylotenera mobilis JLW8]